MGLAGRSMAAEISMAGLLDDMTNLTAMAEFPNPPYVTRQFSSYDRASTTPADPKTWFANNDCGNYLRIEDRDGRKEHVMADMQGPGAIVRIWSPNPGGTLRIYLDGKETPALAAPMADLLGGKHPLLPRPIAAESEHGLEPVFSDSLRQELQGDLRQGRAVLPRRLSHLSGRHGGQDVHGRAARSGPGRNQETGQAAG